MRIYTKFKRLLAPKNRDRLQKWWLLIVISYDALRAYVVSLIFGKHGVSGYHYFLYELVFSVIFSIASFRFITSFIDSKKRKLLLYGILSFISFFAPDLYILIKGDGIPLASYIILAVYLSITTTVTVLGFVKDTKKRKSQLIQKTEA